MSRKNTSQRDSGRIKRKLNDDSDDSEISLDRNLDLFIDFEVVKEGHRDLFGELIPPDECVSNEEAKNKSNKKTPRKRKRPYEELFNTPRRPERVFIPTQRFFRAMKEGHKELLEIMARMSSNKVSIVSTDSLNISGVQHLQDSPQISPQQVLEGMFAFVDYKMDNKRDNTSISQQLIKMGAKVEKTFNRKVTHVMFCDGYRSTYNKAIERNIPLVSVRWMKHCRKANKMLDPADYPPVGLEKYTKTPPRKINIPKCRKYKKKLGSDNGKCDNLVKSKFDNLRMNCNNENEEKCPIIETPQKTTVSEHDFYKSIDVVKLLSNDLCKELNVPDDQVDELDASIPIQIIRTFLTPNGKEKTNSKELISEISKIEDRLNLNFQARKKFRRLLFPSDKDLNNIEEQ